MKRSNNTLELLYGLASGPICELVTYWPGSLGFRMRYFYYKRRLKFLGRNVKIDTGVFFQNPQFISISENCWIDKNVVMLAGLDNSSREKIVKTNNKYPGLPGEVFIGKNVHIGIGCILSGISAGIYISDDCSIAAHGKVYAFTNHYRSEKDPSNQEYRFAIMVPHNRQCIVEGSIYLEENVGVALNSVILPGVTIESDSFIALNTVVTHNIERNSICSGNPGKVIKKRFIQK